MKKKSLVVVLSLFIIIFLFAATLFINDWLIVKKNQTKIRKEELRVEELEKKVEQYKDGYVEVLELRDRYRSSIKEILTLLYNKDIPMQIGGPETPSLENSDEVVLLQLRQAINTMRDDQRMLDDVKKYLSARQSFIDSFPFIWPVKTNGVPKISSGYGFRDDLFGDGEVHFHSGIDVPGDLGDPIVATASGKVRNIILNDEKMGDIIVLEHKFGFTTGYSHLDGVYVRLGQIVERGEKIGAMGNKGTHSLGAHVHYEVRKNNQPIDPFDLLTTNY